MLSLAVSGRIANVSWDQKWAVVLTALTITVCLGCGGVLLFGRQWISLDIRRGSVIRWRGLVWKLRKLERLPTDFDAVVIVLDARDSDTMNRYPVKLRAAAGKDFDLTWPADFGESRLHAEFLSRFLNLPLVDVTSERATGAYPEFCTASLSVRLLAAEPEQAVPLPPAMRSQILEAEDGVTVVLPAGLLGGTLSINASLRGLVIKHKTSTTEVSSEDLLDIDYSTLRSSAVSERRALPGSEATSNPDLGIGLIIKSRKEWIQLDHRLPADELRHLTWRLRRAIAGR